MYDDDNYINGSPDRETPYMNIAEPDYTMTAEDKNPKKYANIPSYYTRRIPQAGRITYKSECAKNVLFG